MVQVIKNLLANAGNMSSIPGLGRSPGEGNSNPLQYSGLENSLDRGAWQATVHGIAKSPRWLSDWAGNTLARWHTHQHLSTKADHKRPKCRQWPHSWKSTHPLPQNSGMFLPLINLWNHRGAPWRSSGRIQCFHCRGLALIPSQGARILTSYTVWPKKEQLPSP